jgi:hypothetical protein
MKGGEDGAVIIAGDPANSLMIKIQSASTAHFGQMTPEELSQVKAWIEAGAKEK